MNIKRAMRTVTIVLSIIIIASCVRNKTTIVYTYPYLSDILTVERQGMFTTAIDSTIGLKLEAKDFIYSEVALLDSTNHYGLYYIRRHTAHFSTMDYYFINTKQHCVVLNQSDTIAWNYQITKFVTEYDARLSSEEKANLDSLLIRNLGLK